MESIYFEFFAVIILFSAAVFSIIIRKKELIFYLLTAFSVLAGLFPYLNSISYSEYTAAKTLSIAALFIFPFLFYLNINAWVLNFKRHSDIIMLGFNAVFATCGLMFSAYVHVFLVLNSIFYYSFVATAGLMTGLFSRMIILSAVSLAAVLHSGYGFLRHDFISIASGNCMILVALFFVLLVFFKQRIVTLRERMSYAVKSNMALTHQITRLKGSVDRYRSIIEEKDDELLQLARHSSLAEMTTGITHEITQPLTGIKGISQNMIDDINSEDFEKHQALAELNRIMTLVDKSASIIDHIRSFSRKKSISLTSIDLNVVVLDAIDLLNRQFKNSNIDVIFVLEESIPKIMGDRISLEQLIVNLLLNSRDAIIEKWSDESESKGTIRINTAHESGKVRMIIEDNGTGIPKELLRKIWTPFFTTKRKERGTGVGLSISRKIINEHMAEAVIDSSGNGTIFSVIFPVPADSVV